VVDHADQLANLVALEGGLGGSRAAAQRGPGDAEGPAGLARFALELKGEAELELGDGVVRVEVDDLPERGHGGSRVTRLQAGFARGEEGRD
jgi:hypothetical protein